MRCQVLGQCECSGFPPLMSFRGNLSLSFPWTLDICARQQLHNLCCAVPQCGLMRLRVKTKQTNTLYFNLSAPHIERRQRAEPVSLFIALADTRFLRICGMHSSHRLPFCPGPFCTQRNSAWHASRQGTPHGRALSLRPVLRCIISS